MKFLHDFNVDYNPDFLFAKEAMEKYRARYKKTGNYLILLGYDVLKLLSDLLEDKDITRENIKHILNSGFIYSGAFGNVKLIKGEHDISFPLYPARIENGEIKYW